MDKKINAFLVFDSETDVERWMNSKKCFFQRNSIRYFRGKQIYLKLRKNFI